MLAPPPQQRSRRCRQRRAAAAATRGLKPFLPRIAIIGVVDEKLGPPAIARTCQREFTILINNFIIHSSRFFNLQTSQN